jgi:glycine/D-amino acid oxidase-like deaminating enzyme
VTVSGYLKDARLAIVGAGAVGAALGYRLAQAGASVTIVERSYPGAGTTGSTFAWINGVDKPPLAYHRLNMLSIRDHEDLADEIGGRWVHVTGSLHWTLAADTARTAALEQSVRTLLGWGMRVDRLAPAQVTAHLEPDLVIDPGAVQAVYLVQRAGWVDPIAMAHQTTAAAVERFGATYVRGEVTGMRVGGGMVEALLLADGRELEADVVVNAAGPAAGRVAALAGVSLPVERTPGLLLVSGPAPGRLQRVVRSPEVNLRPEGGGRVMVQWEPLDTHAQEGSVLGPDHPLVVEGMARARAVMPALSHVGIEAVRAGVRPVPKDGLPLVGFDPEIANLYHVVTHSGITLAARLALLVTEELTGGDVEPLQAYRPARLAPGAPARPPS